MTELEKTATALETEVASIIRSSDYLNESDVDEVAKMLLHRLAEMVNTDAIYEGLSDFENIEYCDPRLNNKN